MAFNLEHGAVNYSTQWPSYFEEKEWKLEKGCISWINSIERNNKIKKKNPGECTLRKTNKFYRPMAGSSSCNKHHVGIWRISIAYTTCQKGLERIDSKLRKICPCDDDQHRQFQFNTGSTEWLLTLGRGESVVVLTGGKIPWRETLGYQLLGQ